MQQRNQESRWGDWETRLAEALLEASDTLLDGFDSGHYLRRLSDHCVALPDARAAGVMLIDGGEAGSFAVSSRNEAMALDLLETQRQGGPCLDSCSSAAGAASLPPRGPRRGPLARVHKCGAPPRRRHHLRGAPAPG
ncbi:hypothetical protein [Streptomyces sp. NPDC002845]